MGRWGDVELSAAGNFALVSDSAVRKIHSLGQIKWRGMGGENRLFVVDR